MKILLVEDEPELLKSMKQYLSSERFQCETAKDYKEGIDKLMKFEYDCVVIDITLPHGSGLDLIKKLKEENENSGIIVVSAKDSVDDKIKGLALGADDYLTKPFHLSELNARIKSVLRRKQFDGQPVLHYGDITVHPDSFSVKVKNEVVTLTQKEYDLLLYFLSNKNRVLTKSAIADHLCGDTVDEVDSLFFVYGHIKNLRKKLMEKTGFDHIKNIYGIGYKFELE